jgi:hypothetical protein
MWKISRSGASSSRATCTTKDLLRESDELVAIFVVVVRKLQERAK